MRFFADIDNLEQDDSTSLGEKMLLYWLLREHKPEVVVETGTHKGVTTLYMAHALYDNGWGHVTTCDPGDWGAQANFNRFPDLAKLITYKQCRGDEFRSDEPIEFLFVDGLHEYEEVQTEMVQLLPQLAPRATVVFHDCWGSYNPLNKDVNEAVEDMLYQMELRPAIWLPTTNALRIYTQNDSLKKP